jgi:hypothetical protein
MRTAILGTCLVFVAAAMLTAPASAQDGLVPQWLFDGSDAEDELLDWGALNALLPLEIDDVKDAAGETRSVLLTESTGGDPYMFPGANWNTANYEPFPGDTYNILSMSIRVNQAATWQVYYVTMGDLAWGEVMRQNFDIPAGDDFQDIEVVLERGGWQDDDVKIFRIDAGTAAGVAAEIDYISFTGPPAGAKAVDAHEKLATQWAALRDAR